MDFLKETEASSWSTYLAGISVAEDSEGNKYVVKRNRGKLDSERLECLTWLMQEKPKGLLAPVELRGELGESWQEVYPYIDWRLMSSMKIHDSKGGVHPAWNLGKALSMIEKIARAAGKMHEVGFIHSDIRDRNVFVNPEALEVLLFDYNLVTKPHFMKRGEDTWNDVPPEYFHGNTDIDFTFDVYQIGGLLRELTFSLDHKNRKFVPFFEMPEAVEHIVHTARHPNMSERYRNGYELAEAVRSVKI